MSIQAIDWALRQEITHSPAKFVLVILANFCSDTGKAYPSISTISDITSQKYETVQSALHRLEATGLIKDTGKKYGQTQQVTVWQLPKGAWQRPPKTGELNTPEMGGVTREKTPENGGVEKHQPISTREQIDAKEVASKNASRNTPPKTPPKTPENGGRSFNHEPSFPNGKEKAADGETLKFTDGWCQAYERRFQSKYFFKAGRDGKAVSMVLKIDTAENLLALVERAREQTDQRTHWACVTQTSEISQFVGALNKIRDELARSEPHTKTQAEMDEERREWWRKRHGTEPTAEQLKTVL